MAMRSHLVLVLAGAGLLLGCGSKEAPESTAEEEGGSDGNHGSGGVTGAGGKKTGGGSGGSTPAGMGGAAMGGSQASGGAGDPPGSGGAPQADAAVSTPDAAPDPTPTGMAPFGCTNCKPLFDGKSLEGFETRDPNNWIAKDGVLASQGTTAPIWTKADLGDYRIFFKVRQVKGNHKPDTIFFGKRPGPGAGTSGALGGAQFQPPNGGSWDYGAGGTFTRDMNPMWDEHKWHSCEVLVKEAGSFRAACCPMEPVAPCKLVLTWKGTGRKHPWAIQMHNGGLFDEYKDIYIEENPTVDELLCLKGQTP
jgi:hypothetical protein